MTSELETLKTNEFLRRRKLRLQQVREQSKDIAKKIRQRAKVETLRQVVDLDAKKQKEYFDRQEKLVKRLEVLYARGLNNVGASHHSATELTRQDVAPKTDLSKLRGREATAELRKKRQEKLDQQKKLLDRKVQARETANEISREKSTVALNKLTKAATSKVDENTQKAASATEIIKEITQDNDKVEPDIVTKNDMGTQWDVESIPKEWEPTVPALKLPRDDQISLKDDEITSKSDQSKRLDLFAVSKEMPTDLGARHGDTNERRDTVRPSLNLVSEYLQTRKLRLRETEVANTAKKHDDISSLKQTILRTRINRAEGSPYDACHVLDEQVIPVPSWHAERTCECCAPKVTRNKSSVQTKQFNTVTNSQINRIFSSIRPVNRSGTVHRSGYTNRSGLVSQSGLINRPRSVNPSRMMNPTSLENLRSVSGPSPVLRSASPFRRNKGCQRIIPSKPGTSTGNSKPDLMLNKKSSVTMYNHNTRDTRDLLCVEPFVVRDQHSEEDAYAQAIKEASMVETKDNEHQKRVQDMRNKVAVTKQAVEKEYKDTMSFLNSLPKEKGNKVTKTAYMDDRRQQMHNENRQHKLQQEYRQIEKECRRHHSCINKRHTNSKSPLKEDVNDNFDSRDFQYSWMPVPESDGNLAIHAIPNTLKKGKMGNSVKFSQVDSYHEYRSRHKHTPPTKDTASHEKRSTTKRPDTIIIDENVSESTEDSTNSTASDSSSVENLRLNKSKQNKAKDDLDLDRNSSDAERIIIYKILDTKSDKKARKKNKLLSEIAKSLTSIETAQKSAAEVNDEPVKKHHKNNVKQDNATDENSVPFENISEGIYKIPEENRDNISNGVPICIQEENQCQCRMSKDKRDQGTTPEWESTPATQTTRTPSHSSSTCKKHTSPPTENQKVSTSAIRPTTTTSGSSFLTATTTEKSRAHSDGGYIKLVEEAGQDTGKFFLGSTSFLKDAAYEVVIQLRKKDDSKEDKNSPDKESKKSDNVKNKEHDNVDAVDLVTLEPQTNLQIPKDTGSQGVSISSSEKATNSLSDTQQESVDNIAVSDSNDQNPTITTDDKKTPSKEKKDVSDKGTTTAQNDFSVPLEKYDPPSRPATTTYTQTTNSPIHRPMYIHMSSSTSTAYMSPPDMIMPKFMRRDSVMTDYEVHEFKKSKIIHNPNVYDKNSKKCRHTKKINYKENMDCRKNAQNTPPNSARSSCYTYENLEVHKPSSKISRHEKIRCKCLNCASSPKDCPKTKKQCTKHKNIPSDRNRLLENLNILNNRNITSKNKYVTSVRNRKKSGPNLNPVVKGYINKLLALNREGLKAIEVAEQECSSVETPGSSVINIPYNIDERKCIANKISLEEIKKSFLRQFIDENLNYNDLSESKIPSKISLPRQPRRKTVHKVKSLNISKRLIKNLKNEESKPVKNRNLVSTSTTTDDNNRTFASSSDTRSRQRSSQSSRQSHSARPSSTSKDYNTAENRETITSRSEKTENRETITSRSEKISIQNKKKVKPQATALPLKKDHIMHKGTITDTSPETESTKEPHNYYKNKVDIPISMSTQTKQNTESDFMKLAEDKLQNMEKIADLTEKCTVRLSNLAKVLEEVRKKKSLTYSQISASDSTDSQLEQKSGNIVKSPIPIDVSVLPNMCEITSGPTSDNKNTISGNEKAPPGYISFLTNIPKPLVHQLSDPEISSPVLPSVTNLTRPIPVSPANVETNTCELTKSRQKPPPALSRIHLKHNQDFIVPHELSTVIEVDSPMSLKNKTPSSRNDVPNTSSNENKESAKTYKSNGNEKDIETSVNPDLLQSNLEMTKQPKLVTNETSEDSKFQMIDLKHFNQIMLEPFISIHEYAKKYNVGTLDEGSNIEELQKDDLINDDMSSLHSDGSLPDVIAELLKRNIITEPFKFDTPSNVNSTTISSESTLSLLALSKARKGKKKANVVFRNKENICETSDTMSISSNPDLENAFKKLGMGWASSTLKKTKERLALSSSSNTSSSSISQLKLKTFNQDIPALVTDSVSSVLLSKSEIKGKSLAENSKNVKQQTTFPHSMTVNEFLNNELADKITFTTNKSGINDTEDEFVSLFETKMPEGLNQQSEINPDEHSNNDSVPSGVNRARTSTPVQIFKSVTYHSSSGSNVSNGLFSNADDLSSVKMTSNSMKNNSTSERDELTIPNFSLKLKRSSECSKSD